MKNKGKLAKVLDTEGGTARVELHSIINNKRTFLDWEITHIHLTLNTPISELKCPSSSQETKMGSRGWEKRVLRS